MTPPLHEVTVWTPLLRILTFLIQVASGMISGGFYGLCLGGLLGSFLDFDWLLVSLCLVATILGLLLLNIAWSFSIRATRYKFGYFKGDLASPPLSKEAMDAMAIPTVRGVLTNFFYLLTAMACLIGTGGLIAGFVAPGSYLDSFGVIGVFLGLTIGLVVGLRGGIWFFRVTSGKEPAFSERIPVMSNRARAKAQWRIEVVWAFSDALRIFCFFFFWSSAIAAGLYLLFHENTLLGVVVWFLAFLWGYIENKVEGRVLGFDPEVAIPRPFTVLELREASAVQVRWYTKRNFVVAAFHGPGGYLLREWVGAEWGWYSWLVLSYAIIASITFVGALFVARGDGGGAQGG